MNRLILFTLFSLIGLPAWAAGLYDPVKVDLDASRQICCAQFGKIVFSDSFDKPDVWNPKYNNFENRLSITFGKEYQGTSCLFVSGENVPKSDTAWGVSSNLIPLTETGIRFALSFQISTDVLIQGGMDEGKAWQNAVAWYDKDGELISEQRYAYCAYAGPFGEILVYGQIPERAAQFSLHFGFDRPNVDEGKFVALRSVCLSVFKEDLSYAPAGSFCSEILTEGGTFSWTADVPEGTAVKFQLASANSLDGIHSAPFAGPDGTSNSYFDAPFETKGAFFRYKAFLFSNKDKTPTLKSVTIGNTTNDCWTRRQDGMAPRVKIVSETPTTNNRTPLVVEITDSAPILWDGLKISVDGQEATDKFKRSGSRLTYDEKANADSQPWSDGLHTVDVTIADYYNNRNAAKKCFFIGESPKTPKITMRDDGMTLIDGQPFFPIGIYGVMKREFNDFNFDKAFADLKKAGFNFAHSYNNPRDDDFLAAALKYDFKLWNAARFPDERFINVERHCPAILAWYLGDDTSANTTPTELFDRDDAVKAVDPTRITTQADGIHSQAQVSNYQDYVLATDNFLPEIYPVRTTKPESARDCVAITICDMKRAASDIRLSGGAPRSVWPIIQYFQGWGWQRFPTFDELNAMSFASIIYGAHGITWYTYGGTVEPERKRFNYGVTTTPERWQNISTVATRIRDLSPVLMERTGEQPNPPEILTGPKKDSFENDSISCLLKSKDGFVYLLTVNSTQAPIQAKFDLSPFAAEDASVEVLYEDRGVSLSKGTLTDTFPGFAVHIYKIKSR